MEIDKSSLVVSKAGRDQGQLFYVIDADEQYVYLADGKSQIGRASCRERV